MIISFLDFELKSKERFRNQCISKKLYATNQITPFESAFTFLMILRGSLDFTSRKNQKRCGDSPVDNKECDWYQDSRVEDRVPTVVLVPEFQDMKKDTCWKRIRVNFKKI